jgi:hypothetical protein
VGSAHAAMAAGSAAHSRARRRRERDMMRGSLGLGRGG